MTAQTSATLAPAGPASGPTRKTARSRLRAQGSRAGLAMVAPMMLGYIALCLIPIGLVFWLSLTDWSLVGTPNFIGLGNYERAFGTPLFWQSLTVTAIYSLTVLPIQWVISLALALLLERALPGSKIFRVIYLIPWVTTPIAVTAVFRWMFDPLTGVLNGILRTVGIPAVQWFSEEMALTSVAIINVWQYSGYTTLLFLVGLQAIPDSYLEAAALDGASYWRTLWHIKLPQLRPTLLFITVTGVIGSFQIFDTVFGLTKGGPGDTTRVFYYYIYEQAFSFSDIGYASALCVILFLLLLVFTVLQFKAFADKDERVGG